MSSAIERGAGERVHIDDVAVGKSAAARPPQAADPGAPRQQRRTDRLLAEAAGAVQVADPGGRRRRLVVAVSAGFGILGSCLLALLFANADARTERAAFEERARDYQHAIADALERAAAVTSIVQGHMAASAAQVSRAEFTGFAAKVRDAMPIELRDFAWAPRVDDADRAAFEQAVRVEGITAFEIRERDTAQRLVPAGRRPVYFPVLYIDPVALSDRVLGYDFASEPQRLDALQRARSSGRPAATAPLLTNLGAPGDGSVFILVGPVWDGSHTAAGWHSSLESLRGVVLGVLDTRQLIERVLAGKTPSQDLDVLLFDPSGPPGTRRIYWHPSANRAAAAAAPAEVALRAQAHLELPVQVADQRWGLLIARPPADFGGGIGARAVAALLVGLALTAGLVAYLIVTLRHALRLEALTERLRRAAVDLAVKGAQVAHLARHDPLTGLDNRLAFQERLRAALESHGTGRPCVFCLDLDRFKAINDTFGHPAGDALLGLVAGRLRSCVRPEDTIARMGGDEFAILLEEMNPADAPAVAQRVVEAIARPYEIRGNPMVVGVSIGIAFATGAQADADLLMRSADLALYRAKHDGRGTWCFFESAMETAAQGRRTLEANLRRAVVEMAFELHFQPVLRLHDRRICGFEALLRWDCPGVGRVSPAEFIPIAEECGLIVPIGQWVLHTACREAATWPAPLRVAVNLSAAQFISPNLLASVNAALADAGLDPARLELEITETLLLHDTRETLATLHALKARGLSISMDDFGTGYSSLSYLCKFPFDRLKIDQSFVREMPLREDARSVVHAVVGLCRDLGIATIAEGVETEEHLRGVLAAQCDEVQGYLFSHPLPPSALPALLAAPLQSLPA